MRNFCILFWVRFIPTVFCVFSSKFSYTSSSYERNFCHFAYFCSDLIAFFVSLSIELNVCILTLGYFLSFIRILLCVLVWSILTCTHRHQIFACDHIDRIKKISHCLSVNWTTQKIFNCVQTRYRTLNGTYNGNKDSAMFQFAFVAWYAIVCNVIYVLEIDKADKGVVKKVNFHDVSASTIFCASLFAHHYLNPNVSVSSNNDDCLHTRIGINFYAIFYMLNTRDRVNVYDLL